MKRSSQAIENRALSFACEGQTLQAVLTTPKPGDGTPGPTLGVLIVVGGPQYRAGSHRQFTLLARDLAQHGFPVLRFDQRGMGDSSGSLHDFKQITPDIGAALTAFETALPGLHRTVIWGLCDGASAALLYWQQTRDRRVAGLCLLNPWVRSEASLAKATVKHYYLDRLKQPDFWRKLFRGGIAREALLSLISNLRRARSQGPASTTDSLSFQHAMAAAWLNPPGPILLLLSGRDLTAQEFLETVASDPAWSRSLELPQLTRHDLPEADHTFSNRSQLEQAHARTIEWLHTFAQEVSR